MSTVFILGPSVEAVEPEPVVAPPLPPGRRGVEFEDPATSPGGTVHLRLLPEVVPGDVVPINVYAFYVNPPSSVPTGEDRTPDWFFKSGAPSGSAEVAHAPEGFDVVVPNVLPGAYHVQTVLEYPAA